MTDMVMLAVKLFLYPAAALAGVALGGVCIGAGIYFLTLLFAALDKDKQ